MRLLEIPHPLRITSCPTKLYSIFFYPVGVDSRTLHYHLTKAQVAEDSRRAIFQRRTATPAEGAKCVNVLNVLAIAIVCGFAACWLPSVILSFILVLTAIIILPNCGVPIYLHVFHFIAIANSAVNPSICFIFSRKYRRELKALLK